MIYVLFIAFAVVVCALLGVASIVEALGDRRRRAPRTGVSLPFEVPAAWGDVR